MVPDQYHGQTHADILANGYGRSRTNAKIIVQVQVSVLTIDTTASSPVLEAVFVGAH